MYASSGTVMSQPGKVISTWKYDNDVTDLREHLAFHRAIFFVNAVVGYSDEGEARLGHCCMICLI